MPTYGKPHPCGSQERTRRAYAYTAGPAPSCYKQQAARREHPLLHKCGGLQQVVEGARRSAPRTIDGLVENSSGMMMHCKFPSARCSI